MLTELPPEILFYFLKFLNTNDLYSLFATNSHFHHIGKDDEFWKYLLIDQKNLKPSYLTYRQYFLQIFTDFYNFIPLLSSYTPLAILPLNRNMTFLSVITLIFPFINQLPVLINFNVSDNTGTTSILYPPYDYSSYKWKTDRKITHPYHINPSNLFKFCSFWNRGINITLDFDPVNIELYILTVYESGPLHRILPHAYHRIKQYRSRIHESPSLARP